MAWDPDLRPVETAPLTDHDAKKWSRAENWGAWFAYPDDGSGEYREVWMLRLGCRVRFVARGGLQYGPEHPHVVAATYWAFGHGWLDPTATRQQNIRCQVEVRCGGADAWKAA